MRRAARPSKPGSRWHLRLHGRAEIGSVQGLVIDLKTGRQDGGAGPRREGTVIGLKPSRAEGPKLDD